MRGMSAPPSHGLLFGQPEVEADRPQGLYVRVALNTPVRREFSYLLPEIMTGIEEGVRVRVPFGQRNLVGVVVGVDPHPPVGVAPDRVRPVSVVLDQQPLLTKPLLRLAKFIADSTYCSWGNALAAMLPAALRRDRARRTVAVVELVADRKLDPEALAELAEKRPKQEKALAYLGRAGGPVELRDFLNRTGLSRSPLETLARRGLVKFGRRTGYLDPFGGVKVKRDQAPELTDQQKYCVQQLVHSLDQDPGQGYLLFGVTGSGKTEVYLHALEHCLAQGRGGIVLVPEIALTPQTVARFRARCGEVAVLHSGLTDAERHDQWLAIREGRMRVVVGARSALFAPVNNLGLIIVDEEHESSFKQESVPRYHAREVAQERARLEGAVCVLGTATPALESWYAVHHEGSLRLLELPERVAGGSLPKVQIVDMRVEKPEFGHWLVISSPLRMAMQKALGSEQKAILFLNRRGYAPAWQCRACGKVVYCPSCDVPITFHKWRKRALCHLCLAEYPQPTHCKECKSNQVQLVGVGTERAEESVERMLPEARLCRMDRDTMIRRESYEKVLHEFATGKFNVLLGTQMVAKGLDFPDVTVVGVLNADTALHIPDFRATERCFNLISQVSGRAGRSHRGGYVVVQTFLPDHPAIRFAAAHDYRAFAKHELVERKLFHYPPFSAAIRIMFEAPDVGRVEAKASQGAELLRGCRASSCEILGPAAPPVERIRGRVRRQIFIKAMPASALRDLAPALYTLCQKQGVTVDRL
jgi:primosomal protein N' (replication factor Y) (superfamily II helicase)